MSNFRLTDMASHLPGLFGRKNWHLPWQTFSLARSWPEIAGEEIAAHTRPAYIRNRILWVEARSSVWIQHLQFMKPQLLGKVNDFLPDAEIADIRWIMQSSDSSSPPGRITKKLSPVDPVESESFKQLASTVKNQECRNALIKLWLAFQRNR